MKGFYSWFCLVVVVAYAYVSFTGRTYINFGGKRQWAKPGSRTIYYHK